MFKQLDNIVYGEYSTEMSDLPQHLETRRREAQQARRARRAALIGRGIEMTVATALALGILWLLLLLAGH